MVDSFKGLTLLPLAELELTEEQAYFGLKPSKTEVSKGATSYQREAFTRRPIYYLVSGLQINEFKVVKEAPQLMLGLG
jgi:hypothetical protein